MKMYRKAKLICCAAIPLALVCFSNSANAQAQPTVGTTQQSSPFAEIHKDSWIYSAVSTLVKDHVLPESPNGEGGIFPFWQHLTRYEVAVVLARQIDITFRIKSSKSQDEKIVFKSADDTALFEKLTIECTVELKTLGMDVPLVLRKLDGMEQEARAALSPFPDVAPTHWASASIERLRHDGVLIGYPGGTFLSGRAEEKEEGKRK